jgi:hypothetical protein
LAKLRIRAPAIDHVLAVASGFTWLGRLLVLLAFVTGLSLSALDGSRKINILAFPLIGLIAWNLLVYVALLIASVRPRSVSRRWSTNFYEHYVGRRIEGLLRHSSRFNAPLASGLRRFTTEWATLASPALVLRVKQCLHLAAAAVALGLIAGLYVRGIALRYEAGWESTFLGPGRVHGLLVALYGPAAALTGIQIPSIEEIKALRWAGTTGGGEAAAWIHLIATTAVLYIVLPRLLAALTATLQLWQLSRRVPLPPSLAGYARALVMGVGGGAVRDIVSVTPYAYVPAPESVAGLEVLLAAAIGGNLNVELHEPIRYGEEEAVGGRMSSAAARVASWNVLLMTLAATPEVENHGALIAGMRDWLTQNASGAPLLVVIDEAPYAARMGSDPGFEHRILERRRLWSEFVAGYGLRACLVNLTQIRTGAPGEALARDAARAALWTASQ